MQHILGVAFRIRTQGLPHWVRGTVQLEDMDKKSTGMDMKIPQAAEQPQGLHVEPIEADELNSKIERGILSLEYNALDISKNKNMEVRRSEVKGEKLYRERLQTSAHGTVLVAKDGENIIGVLTLNREAGVGMIDGIWLKDSHHQDRIIMQLLLAAKDDLRTGGQVRCEAAVIKADDPSADLRRVFHEELDSDSRMFFSPAAKDN